MLPNNSYDWAQWYQNHPTNPTPAPTQPAIGSQAWMANYIAHSSAAPAPVMPPPQYPHGVSGVSAPYNNPIYGMQAGQGSPFMYRNAQGQLVINALASRQTYGPPNFNVPGSYYSPSGGMGTLINEAQAHGYNNPAQYSWEHYGPQNNPAIIAANTPDNGRMPGFGMSDYTPYQAILPYLAPQAQTVQPLPQGGYYPYAYYPYGYGGGGGGGGGYSGNNSYKPSWYTKLLQWNVNRG